jgi:hypothetical protein
MSFGLTQTVDFVARPPKTQPKSPMTGEGQHELPLVQGNLASQLKINTQQAFWPHKAVDFVAWPPKIQPKAPRTGLRPTWRTIGPRKSGLPAHQIVILQIISCGAKLRERPINTLITPWPPSGPRSRRKWLTWTWRSSSPPPLPEVLV